MVLLKTPYVVSGHGQLAQEGKGDGTMNIEASSLQIQVYEHAGSHDTFLSTTERQDTGDCGESNEYVVL